MLTKFPPPHCGHVSKSVNQAKTSAGGRLMMMAALAACGISASLSRKVNCLNVARKTWLLAQPHLASPNRKAYRRQSQRKQHTKESRTDLTRPGWQELRDEENEEKASGCGKQENPR